jgi:4-amino-4-deoxy-L-arabinose transferase-like glycosyltransferase
LTIRRALILVILAGALLRFFPIWFGLPYLRARPDEETTISHAIAILGGDPNPHFFHWPSLTFYLVAGLLQLGTWIRVMVDGSPSLTPGEQIVLARGLVAAAGTLTLWCLFRIGLRIGGAAAGLIAALFLCVSILHVRESHFAMTDVLMTMFLVISLDRLLVALDERTPREVNRGFAVAGVAAGLATSAKYSAAAILAPMCAAQLVLAYRAYSCESRLPAFWWLPSIGFVLAAATSFLATTPYALLDTSQFTADFVFDLRHLSQGHVGELGRGWTYHLVRSLPYGVGMTVCTAAIAGLIPLVRSAPSQALVLGVFVGAYYAVMGSGRTVFFRYVLPIVPFACVFAAVGVTRVGAWLGSHIRVRHSAVVTVMTAIIAIPAAVNCLRFDRVLARTDARVIAVEWLSLHAKPSESLGEAPNEYARLDLGDIVHRWYVNGSDGSFRNAGDRVPDWLVLHESPLWTYAQIPHALQALALTRYELRFVARATTAKSRSAVYDLQDAFFMPVSRLDTVERPGPTVLIYRNVR